MQEHLWLDRILRRRRIESGQGNPEEDSSSSSSGSSSYAPPPTETVPLGQWGKSLSALK